MALVKYNNNSISAVTSAASIPSGALVPIKTLSASSSSTLSFVDGSSDVVLDSTYPIYVFKFINIHASAQANFSVGFRDGGSDYDATKTTTSFSAYHDEGDSATSLAYQTGDDLAQSTSFQRLVSGSLGTQNDSGLVGELFLFNPSSTTFVKHFIAKTQYFTYHSTPYSFNTFVAGYCNTTTAIDGVQFKMESGNVDSGTIKLYGIKDS